MRWNGANCPYYRGVGICATGCYSEPECITCEPVGGWPRVRTQRGYAFARKAHLRRVFA